MITPEMLILAVGAAVGFFAGRFWSETFRGRHDARKAWRGRRSYRRRK